MKQKIFLTSVIAMGFVAPAMAEPSNTDTFPQDGLMLEDYTYTNAATSTNMAGVYEGTVNAEAQYTDNLYQLVAGQYLPGNSETPIDCDQNGYFCPGDNNGVYYSSSAQGLTQCPSGYGNSGTGASANTDCFRTCSTSDVAHSSGTVNGGVYYDGTSGDGVNACEPTACVNGWHRKQGLNVASTIGNTAGDNSAYVDNAGTFAERNYDGQGAKGASYYGLSTSDHNSFAIDYGNNGILHGHTRCSTTPGTFDFNYGTGQLNAITTFSSLTDETGQEGARYCYCNVDGYTPAGGTMQSVSSSWVFRNDIGDASSCASWCANSCAGALRNTDSTSFAFRAGVFGSVAPGLASCEANTITINWDGASATEINANNAGTATYGSDIRTPRSATPVPGKTFTGWRFSAPQQASVQEP